MPEDTPSDRLVAAIDDAALKLDSATQARIANDAAQPTIRIPDHEPVSLPAVADRLTVVEQRLDTLEETARTEKEGE